MTPTVIRRQLQEQLTALGYAVAGPIGQSDFKCSLAVKRHPEDSAYALAILIDDEGHYGNENLIEQYYQRPAMLRAFGWKLLQVFAKDWLEDRRRVIGFVCEVPTSIDQRLFALGRVIQQEMD